MKLSPRTLVMLSLALTASACSGDSLTEPGLDPEALQATVVPGFEDSRYDQDGNGYTDAGVYVTGKYVSVYAYDGFGDWYRDLGDGRVQGTVGSIEELDSSTLTVCNYQVSYRADFGNDPFMNEGWITNLINCSGFGDNGSYNYLIVSQTDPRYTDNPDWAIWGTWEYHVLTISGSGNLVRPLTGPENHVGG